jgi:hypothetical protein
MLREGRHHPEGEHSDSESEHSGSRGVRGGDAERSDSSHSLDGLVIGERPHIPKRLAPFARALVTVYESARYSDREFAEDEYDKYMHLLQSLVYRCGRGSTHGPHFRPG